MKSKGRKVKYLLYGETKAMNGEERRYYTLRTVANIVSALGTILIILKVFGVI